MTRIDAGTPPRAPAPAGNGWTAGRVIALVTGSVLLLISLALLAGGGTLAWADEEQHHSGYVTTSTAAYSTQGYALASDAISLHGSRGWLGLFVDEVRIRISSEPSRPLFAGIASARNVERYLAGVGYAKVGARGEHNVAGQPGAGVPAPPGAALPWAVRAQGSGNLTLTWRVQDGDWMVVVMNPDASPGITVRADAGISSLALPWLAGELLAAGLLIGVAAAGLIIVPVRLASRPGPVAPLA
jgi:hypothetical protein